MLNLMQHLVGTKGNIMALPLIPLILGVLGGGLFGQKGSDFLAKGRRQDQKDLFRQEVEQMQAGLDLNTPGGRDTFSQRQTLNPETAGFGNQFMRQAQQLEQQQKQYEHSFNNISTVQDQAFNQVSAEGQARLKQQMEIARMRLNQDQTQFSQQNPFQPMNTDLLSFQKTRRNEFQQQIKPFTALREQVVPLIASLQSGDTAIDAFSQGFKFIKTLDPGMVTSDDLDSFNSAKSIWEELANKFDKTVSGGGFDVNDRQQMAHSLKIMFDASLKGARSKADYYSGFAAGDEQTGVPAFDPNRIIGGADLSELDMGAFGGKKKAGGDKAGFVPDSVQQEDDGREFIILPNGQKMYGKSNKKKKTGKSPSRFF